MKALMCSHARVALYVWRTVIVYCVAICQRCFCRHEPTRRGRGLALPAEAYRAPLFYVTRIEAHLIAVGSVNGSLWCLFKGKNKLPYTPHGCCSVQDPSQRVCGQWKLCFAFRNAF